MAPVSAVPVKRRFPTGDLSKWLRINLFTKDIYISGVTGQPYIERTSTNMATDAIHIDLLFIIALPILFSNHQD